MTIGDSHIGSNRQHRLSDQVSANTFEPLSFMFLRGIFAFRRRVRRTSDQRDSAELLSGAVRRSFKAGNESSNPPPSSRESANFRARQRSVTNLAVEDIDHSRTKTKSPHKQMVFASVSIALSWMSSTGWRSAKRSIAPSTSCRPTLMPGLPSTTSIGPIRAAGASVRPRCRPFLTRYHWQRKNSWRHDRRRQPYRSTQPTPSVRSSIS